MSRTIAVIWHASFSLIAGVLYFFFVLPRWWELMGTTPHTLGLVLRIVVGVLIGLAALPVVLEWVRTRKPELRTPDLALRLRLWSTALHVVAGVLILGAAISEIWLSLDTAGVWLFGIYGAAAAIALLGIFGFYLAYVAELPPPPPKALKPKKERRRRGRKKADEAEVADGETSDEAAETTEDAKATEDAAEETSEETEEKPAEITANESTAEVSAENDTTADDTSSSNEDEQAETESTNGKLRNRRPSGKSEPSRRRRRRLRGGVALDD
ncbi:hypothetical protein BST23_23630 [Mycolicibacterium elephantis]|uniref:Transmembrane protein n=1 Tax=Mycolicibacterium elephantis TaxID=81858 RepID=A0A0M2ZQ38_9MYCO|nr:hypothetical protein [Mycolicibacterium elephantis]KKW65898.1 membrane protein [Mycolicibacterium elephantis]ORA59866.1 hypothetical protein BST23_23630 [Mycolicibacterium elephantis]